MNHLTTALHYLGGLCYLHPARAAATWCALMLGALVALATGLIGWNRR